MIEGMVTQQDKTQILKFARKVLEESLNDSSLQRGFLWTRKWIPHFPISEDNPTSVFVTLYKAENLRGCVGTLYPEPSLFLTVAKTTLESAYHDPRFPPMTVAEGPETRIEVSILSPLRRVKKIEEIVRHTHGVYIKKDFNSRLFRPQVWEVLPSKEEFMAELCSSKAGLAPNAWQDPSTEIYIFTVEKLEEEP